MFTKAAVLGLLAAGLLLAAGIWVAIPHDTHHPAESLVVEDPDKDVGSRAVGAHVVEFRIRNTTAKALRVIGMEGG